jgi:hypothetical protein
VTHINYINFLGPEDDIMKASAFHDADFSPIDLQNPVEEFQGTC